MVKLPDNCPRIQSYHLQSAVAIAVELPWCPKEGLRLPLPSVVMQVLLFLVSSGAAVSLDQIQDITLGDDPSSFIDPSPPGQVPPTPRNGTTPHVTHIRLPRMPISRSSAVTRLVRRRHLLALNDTSALPHEQLVREYWKLAQENDDLLQTLEHAARGLPAHRKHDPARHYKLRCDVTRGKWQNNTHKIMSPQLDRCIITGTSSACGSVRSQRYKELWWFPSESQYSKYGSYYLIDY